MADRYRLKIDIEGGFHNMSNPRRGTVVELDPISAARYLKAGYIERKLTGEIGHAHVPEE
jgi:hypothetical protein